MRNIVFVAFVSIAEMLMIGSAFASERKATVKWEMVPAPVHRTVQREFLDPLDSIQCERVSKWMKASASVVNRLRKDVALVFKLKEPLRVLDLTPVAAKYPAMAKLTIENAKIQAGNFGALRNCQNLTSTTLRNITYDVGISRQGWDSIHVAADIGDAEIVSYLIEKSPHLAWHLTGDLRDTPLHLATRRGHLSTVNCLLDAKAVPTEDRFSLKTPWHEAGISGRTAIIEKFLSIPECRRTLHAADEYSNTALNWAAYEGHVGVVDAILNAEGANSTACETLDRLLAPDRWGNNPVHSAVKKNKAAVLKRLMQIPRSDLLFSRTNKGETPMDLATEGKAFDAMEVFLDAGIPGSKFIRSDKNGDTILHSPLGKFSHPDQVRLVKKLLANLPGEEARQLAVKLNRQGWGPIHLAVRWGDLELLEVYSKIPGMEQKQFFTPTKDGSSLAAIAAMEDNFTILSWLISYVGKDTELLLTRDSKGKNALFYAASRGHKKSFRTLLGLPGAKDAELLHASKVKDWDMIDWIFDEGKE